MSSLRTSRSFSLIRTGRGLDGKSVENHKFPYDASDLAVMQGDTGGRALARAFRRACG